MDMSSVYDGLFPCVHSNVVICESRLILQTLCCLDYL